MTKKKNNQKLVVEHVKQIIDMLEFSEIEFDHVDNTIETEYGVLFEFDEDGMLINVLHRD